LELIALGPTELMAERFTMMSVRTQCELVLELMCKILPPFENDQQEPAYIFGDTTTEHYCVKSLSIKFEFFRLDRPHSPNGLITGKAAAHPTMSGPTSSAPLINNKTPTASTEIGCKG